MTQDEQNPETQDPADGRATHSAEFGLMTYMVGGKAMTMAELKAHAAAEEKASEAMARDVREENEKRQKMRDEGVY